MTYLAFTNLVLFIVASVNFFFGLSILINARGHSTYHRLFATLAFSVAVWTYVMVFYRQADTHALVALRALYLVPLLIPLSFVYFVTEYVGQLVHVRRARYVRYGLMCWATVLGVLVVFTGAIVRDVTIPQVGEKSITFGPGFSLYVLYFLLTFIFGYYLLWRFRQQTPYGVQRRQILFLLLGTTTSSTIALATNLLLPWVSYVALNWTGNLATVLFVGFIFYAIVRHGLFEMKLFTVELLSSFLWIALLVRVFTSEGSGEFVQNIATFLLSVGLGVWIIRAVLAEIKTREQGEKLARYLANANVRLRELDKQKTEFVSVASHQLRSPIAAIVGYASNMTDGTYGTMPEYLAEPTGRILESGKRIGFIVDDFLNVTRIEQGRMTYDMQPHNVSDIVQSALRELRVLGEQKGLSFKVRVPKEPVLIMADEGKLKQVLSNLIDNAIKYTQKGTIELAVTCDIAKARARVSIKDKGIGIAPEELSSLFRKFNRASNANSVNVHGTGLGLYIAQEILKAHHGIVYVTSPGVGKGAMFTVDLPLVAA